MCIINMWKMLNVDFENMISERRYYINIYNISLNLHTISVPSYKSIRDKSSPEKSFLFFIKGNIPKGKSLKQYVSVPT